MGWSTEFRDEGRILRVLIEGRFSASQAMEMTRESVGVAARARVTRIMMDCSKAKFDIPIVDVYQVPDIYSSRGISHEARGAVLMPKGGVDRQMYEFYQDVCRNRGYFVQLFEDEAEAWEWLREA